MAAIRTNRITSSVLLALALIGRSAVGECQSTAGRSSAQPSPASLAAVPVVRVVHGFNNMIYEVTGPLLTRTATDPYPSNICGAQYGGPPTPSPVGTATPDPFVTVAPLTSGIWLTSAPTTNNPQCPVADLVATQQALGIEVVVSSPAPTPTPTPSTRVDNVDFTTDPYVKVFVCKISCPAAGSNNRVNVVLEYHVNATNNVYTLQHDRLGAAGDREGRRAVDGRAVRGTGFPNRRHGADTVDDTDAAAGPMVGEHSDSVECARITGGRPDRDRRPSLRGRFERRQPHRYAPGDLDSSRDLRSAGRRRPLPKVDDDYRWGTLTLYDQYVSPALRRRRRRSRDRRTAC